MNVDGQTLRYSRADILVHVLIHERQHHGDLNTLLYQHGIEPPVVEYRFSLPDRGGLAMPKTREEAGDPGPLHVHHLCIGARTGHGPLSARR